MRCDDEPFGRHTSRLMDIYIPSQTDEICDRIEKYKQW